MPRFRFFVIFPGILPISSHFLLFSTFSTLSDSKSRPIFALFTIFNFFVITEFSHYSGGASRARLPPSNLLHVRFVLVSTGKTIFLNLYCPRRFYAFFPTISNLTSQSNPFLTMVKPVIHHIKQQSNGLIIHHYNKTTTAVSMVYRFFTMGCIFHWMSTK